MATPKKRVRSIGEMALLKELGNLANNDYTGLKEAQKYVERARASKQTKEQELREAEEHLKLCESKVRALKREVAELVNDLGKLGSEVEDIKHQWPAFCAHDVAEWIKLDE
jgi:septal ring factor EnvC (AmiA/AmiB activator)